MIDRLAELLMRRSARERWLLAVLAFVVLPLGFVYGVALPLNERHATARAAVEEARALQLWLAGRQAELAALPPEPDPQARAAAPRTPVGISGIETSLIDSGLRTAVAQLANTADNGVSVRFDAVAFTRLMPWLEMTEAESGYAIAALRLLRGDAPDMVQAELVLEPRP